MDDRWLRFYGFVGRHIIAKVPAEEIEFIKREESPRIVKARLRL